MKLRNWDNLVLLLYCDVLYCMYCMYCIDVLYCISRLPSTYRTYSWPESMCVLDLTASTATRATTAGTIGSGTPTSSPTLLITSKAPGQAGWVWGGESCFSNAHLLVPVTDLNPWHTYRRTYGKKNCFRWVSIKLSVRMSVRSSTFSNRPLTPNRLNFRNGTDRFGSVSTYRRCGQTHKPPKKPKKFHFFLSVTSY